MNFLRRLARALGAGRRVGAQSETAGHDEHDAGQLIRRAGPPQKPARATGPALRAFESLDTLFPVMAATIERARPMVSRVLDGDLEDDYDDLALRQALRWLAHEANVVRIATNALNCGTDLLETELQEEIV